MANTIKGTGGGRRGKARMRVVGGGGNGRGVRQDDNETAEERAASEKRERAERDEAEGIQLLSVVSRVKAQDAKVETARAALKEQTDALNGIFLNAKASSPRFTRGRIRELVNDSKPSERRNVQENEEVRARFRKLMGLPVGLSETERELEERLPDVEREGAFWFQGGYTAGVTGEKRDAPAACVSAGHDNRYDEGWIAGQAVLATGMKGARKTPAAGGAPIQPPAEETPAQRKAREKREETAAKDALATPPAADTVAAPEGPPTTEGVEPAPALDPVQESVKAATEGAGEFQEATEEELAAQNPRKAIQGAREGEMADDPAAAPEAV